VRHFNELKKKAKNDPLIAAYVELRIRLGGDPTKVEEFDRQQRRIEWQAWNDVNQTLLAAVLPWILFAPFYITWLVAQ